MKELFSSIFFEMQENMPGIQFYLEVILGQSGRYFIDEQSELPHVHSGDGIVAHGKTKSSDATIEELENFCSQLVFRSFSICHCNVIYCLSIVDKPMEHGVFILR